MVDSLEDIIEHAEIIVVGNGDPEFQQIFAMKRPEQVLIDLVRLNGDMQTVEKYDGIC